MAFPKPSKYQIFLISLLIVTIYLLLNPGIIRPRDTGESLKIGIVDSGCTVNQSSDVNEYVSFTSTEYGYGYDDESLYDQVGHGKVVCDIIISGTNDVSIYSAKIANGNGQVTYQGLFAAVEYLVEEVDVDIINLSLGGEPYYSEELFEAFEEYADNRIFIAAVGNKANDYTYPDGIIDWPATLPWIIGVGSQEQNTNRSTYSSFGRSASGLYTTEFTHSGRIDGLVGTSFSTPRVTVAYANLWQRLNQQRMDVTPELLNYYMTTSTSRGSFHPEVGWGRPNATEAILDEGLAINGINERDPYQRFQNETWTRSWKIYATSETLTDLEFSGNATEFLLDTHLRDYNWGKILDIDFVGEGGSEGNYTLEISHTKGNTISYSFEYTDNQAVRSILLDHRNTINGFAHQYGIYSRFEQKMREYNIMVDQIQSGETDLSSYDTVIVTEFGRIVDLDRIFSREFNETIFGQYMDYTRSGGTLQVMAPYPSEFNSEGYDTALQQLGAKLLDNRIPRRDEDITYTQNLTDFDIFDGVISIGASGSEIQAMNSSQTSLGSYKFIPQDIGERTQFHSIGINTTLDEGRIFVWSGSKMIQNDYFRDKLDNYDQVLLNLLNYDLLD